MCVKRHLDSRDYSFDIILVSCLVAWLFLLDLLDTKYPMAWMMSALPFSRIIKIMVPKDFLTFEWVWLFQVENLCSLNLICHFADDQDVVVAGKKTVSVFLRYMNELPVDVLLLNLLFFNIREVLSLKYLNTFIWIRRKVVPLKFTFQPFIVLQAYVKA